MRSYEAARTFYSFLEICAWCVIGVGVLVGLMGAAAISEMSSYGYASSARGFLASLAGLVPGVGIALLGFFMLAFVQMGRAAVDTAEYTQQMLKIARDQLDVSRQGLQGHGSAPAGFSSTSEKADKAAVGYTELQKTKDLNTANKPKASGPSKTEKVFENLGRKVAQVGKAAKAAPQVTSEVNSPADLTEPTLEKGREKVAVAGLSDEPETT